MEEPKNRQTEPIVAVCKPLYGGKGKEIAFAPSLSRYRFAAVLAMRGDQVRARASL